MEPPVTPKPMPDPLPDLPTDKLFGIVYITLTGVIDTIIPAAGPWSWLAPLLWWTLPAKTPVQVTPENGGWLLKTGSLTMRAREVESERGADAPHSNFHILADQVQ
ncbi:hypothetical protein DSO57_1005804 [Entomophthora muscae]|uniref:Uncharacterized protein n=1 Tax=Entomophthora muscae TaxID=34485 RepID=A0ACC2TJC2_9FUNG|nr:hypothetical protein DSO57_1005804 [Entomophthora muscae]